MLTWQGHVWVRLSCPMTGDGCVGRAGVTPGYEDEVIFGDGTFVDGSTAELSADGPLRAPWVVYCQGGTHWTHWAVALEAIVADMRACA